MVVEENNIAIYVCFFFLLQSVPFFWLWQLLQWEFAPFHGSFLEFTGFFSVYFYLVSIKGKTWNFFQYCSFSINHSRNIITSRCICHNLPYHKQSFCFFFTCLGAAWSPPPGRFFLFFCSIREVFFFSITRLDGVFFSYSDNSYTILCTTNPL